MSIDHILASITNTPLMVTPDKLAVIMDVLSSRHQLSLDLGHLQGLVPDPSAAAPASRAANGAAAGISILPVTGSLVNRASAGASGMVNYRDLQRQLAAMVRDPDIGGIILDFDSHGGMVAGVDRLARDIRRADREKPVWAFVDTACYSAAYYLAAACGRVILADDTGGVGSAPQARTRPDGAGACVPFVTLSGKCLVRNQARMFDIVTELAGQFSFQDTERLQNLLLEYRAALESMVIHNGHQLAISLASRAFSTTAALSESWHGIHQLRFIKRLSEDPVCIVGDDEKKGGAGSTKSVDPLKPLLV